MAARAVRFVAPFRVDVADVSVPGPTAGEVLVRVEYSGISGGTELLAYRGELDANIPRDTVLPALAGDFRYPFTYGYSAVGTVERSRSDIPEGARVFAFHPHQDVVVARADDVVPIGDHDPRIGTLFPLVETALQVSLDAGVRYGERVAVLGLGPVGMLSALVLQRSGARVVGTDVKEWRRDVAVACGLEAVAPHELPGAVGSHGADLLVEATGDPDVLGERLGLLADEGVALVCSW